MSDELATPEHDKLLAEPELEAQIERLYEWMAKRGRKLADKTAGSNRVAICELSPESITEEVKCPECHGSGKEVRDLTPRQQQVVRHMHLLKGEPELYGKEKTARREQLEELERWLGELAECEHCYGRCVANVYRQGELRWQPRYHTPRDLLIEMLGVDRLAFKEETRELFAQLRKQAGERQAATKEVA